MNRWCSDPFLTQRMVPIAPQAPGFAWNKNSTSYKSSWNLQEKCLSFARDFQNQREARRRIFSGELEKIPRRTNTMENTKYGENSVRSRWKLRTRFSFWFNVYHWNSTLVYISRSQRRAYQQDLNGFEQWSLWTIYDVDTDCWHSSHYWVYLLYVSVWHDNGLFKKKSNTLVLSAYEDKSNMTGAFSWPRFRWKWKLWVTRSPRLTWDSKERLTGFSFKGTMDWP